MVHIPIADELHGDDATQMTVQQVIPSAYIGIALFELICLARPSLQITVTGGFLSLQLISDNRHRKDKLIVSDDNINVSNYCY